MKYESSLYEELNIAPGDKVLSNKLPNRIKHIAHIVNNPTSVIIIEGCKTPGGAWGYKALVLLEV